MIRGKRIISALLVMMLCFGMTFHVQAAGISDTKKKAAELEQKKAAAEKEKSSIAANLSSTVAEMEELKKKIDVKEEELFKKEEELIEAKVEENNQYESMKKRIKYMYENGNGQFIEVLLESKSLGEFLNNAEFITNISDYDRDMLLKFKEVVKQVEEQEKVIKEEYEEMETMQNELIDKQESLQQMLNSKNSEISNLDSEIKKNADALAALEKAAADAERKQNEANDNDTSGAGGSVISGNGSLAHPVPGYSRISSYFGYREQPLAGASTNHKGIDFAAPTGTPIYAASGGTVTSAGNSGKAGKMIVINHHNGMTTYYMHCHKLYVKPGQQVSKGQNIAAVGSTGNSTGPHLHFQVNVNGVPKNPLKYL